ncbi:MAG: hypothetical protein ABL958_03525 [Bdellovibrionia bacterium]
MSSKLVVGIAVLVAAGFMVSKMFGSNDKAKIQKLIQEMAAEASAGDETQGIQIQTKAIKVSRFLSPSFTGSVKTNGQEHKIPSKQEFGSSMTAAIYLMKPLIVEVSGMDVTVTQGSDVAEANVDFNLRHFATEPPFDSARFVFDLKKIDGEWLIDKATGESQRK